MAATETRPLEARIAELEARLQLSELIGRYAHAVDDRDIDTVVRLFTPDGRYVHHGDFVAEGREELERFYRERLSEYGPTFHYSHSQILEFTRGSTATGIVSAHAELAIDGRCVLGGIRYDDCYVRQEDRWRIRERVVRFRYALPWNDVDTRFAEAFRRRWRGVSSATDLPEGLETWRTFYRR